MVELKEPKTYDEQLARLREHGVCIADEEFCKQKLAELNYYRLTAYFLPFRKQNGRYKYGTDFNRVYQIYEFDRKLRNILFSAVEEVEIFLRTKLAYYHAFSYGAEGYMDPENFSKEHQPDKFIANFNREIDNNKKSLFVKHHIEKYGRHFPVWVAVELFTFGMLSRFYDDLKLKDRKKIAKEVYGEVPQNISSWLRCVTDLRNICAHYGRLYYRIFSAWPASFDIDDNQKARLWGAVLALRALYHDGDKWNSEILPSLESLFEEYDEVINLDHIAFPSDWVELLRK